MKSSHSRLLAHATLGIALANASVADDFSRQPQHGVFVMTNDADSNEIVALERYGNGALRETHSYKTGG